MMNDHVPPECAHWAETLPVLTEPGTDPAMAAGAREHLRTCAACQGRLAAYAQLDALLRHNYSPLAPAPRRTEDIMTFIADQDRQTAPPQRDPVPTSDKSPRRFVSRLAAIAAALVVVLLAGFIFHLRFGNAGAGLANPGPPQYSFPGVTGMLASVSMISPNDGWALGQTLATAQGAHGLHEVTFYHYQNGVWTPQYVPVSADFATGGVSGFNGVISMDSATDGWAVASNFNQISDVLHYTGGAWHEAQTAPIVWLQALSPQSVWAIGGQNFGDSILHYDGAQWVNQQLPDAQAVILELHMDSDTSGWALAGLNALNNHVGKVYHYQQGTWTVQSVLPQGSEIYYTALVMTSATEGWALGQRAGHNANGDTTHAPYEQIILHYTNGAWHASKATNLPGNYPALGGLTMVSPTEGWTLGQSTSAYAGATTSDYQQRMFFLHLMNGQWTFVAAPTTGVPADGLMDIAFTSPNDGWATGYVSTFPSSQVVQDTDILQHASPLLLHYHNGKWEVYKGA